MYILMTFLANSTLAILIAAWPAFAVAQGALEKRDVHVAVGEKPRCTTCRSPSPSNWATSRKKV